MTDNKNQENKTEELIKKQEVRQLTEEDLEQVTGGLARDSWRDVATILSADNN